MEFWQLLPSLFFKLKFNQTIKIFVEVLCLPGSIAHTTQTDEWLVSVGIFLPSSCFFYFILNYLHKDLVGGAFGSSETSVAAGLAQDGTHAVHWTMRWTNFKVCIKIRAMNSLELFSRLHHYSKSEFQWWKEVLNKYFHFIHRCFQIASEKRHWSCSEFGYTDY